GIVVINVDLRTALDQIRDAARDSEVVYLVDAKGDYLVHPDRIREFASDLGGPHSWQADFPYFASLAGSTRSASQAVPDASCRPGGAALVPALLVGKEWVGIIETVPNAVFLASATAIGRTTLLVGLVAMLCAAVLALIVARSLTRPINQLRWAVEGIGRNELVTIPAHPTRETGALP